MKLICKFRRFQPWDGAVTTWEEIKNAEKLDKLESILEGVYPDGMTERELNNILWFDSDTVLEWLDMKEPEEDNEN